LTAIDDARMNEAAIVAACCIGRSSSWRTLAASDEEERYDAANGLNPNVD